MMFSKTKSRSLPKDKIFGLKWPIFLALLPLIYGLSVWFGYFFVGGQVVLVGYFLAAFGTWHLGLKRGSLLMLILIINTILIIRNHPLGTADAVGVRGVVGAVFFVISTFFSGWVSHLFHELKATQLLLFAEHEKTEMLLRNTLPDSIAKRLKGGDVLIADHYADTTILFCDLVGFTQLTRSLTPSGLIELLNKIVSNFDQKAEELGVEKIKTIGDAYMVVSGLPEQRADHALVLTKMAIEMLKVVRKINLEEKQQLELRIGIHSGPVVGGVIGTKKFTFDMWGDTVNLAARLESHGVPGKIHLSEASYQLIKEEIKCTSAGQINIKSYGPLTTYFVN